MSEEVTLKKVYFDARRLCWFAALALVGVMITAIYELGTSSVPIVTAGLPTLGAMVAGYVGIDRQWGKAT